MTTVQLAERLDELVAERAQHLAIRRLESTRHSMSLEAQEVDTNDEEEQLRRLTRRLIEKAGSELWKEDA